MKLGLPTVGLEHYKSASQRVRVATEGWAEANLYCPNCPSPTLQTSPVNTPAIDYVCPQCDSPFQLKSQSRPLSHRLTDAAYESMRGAIREGKTPNLFLIHYQPERWEVWDLILVPRFAFSLSVLERRKPLGATARRAGWVGCNILLGNIPSDARIPVIREGVPSDAPEVRRRFARLRPLAQLSLEKRGWTLDVLNVIRLLGRQEFSLSDVYGFEDSLARLHPDNRHIRDKIRQQMQVLRDLGFLSFLGGGNYRLR